MDFQTAALLGASLSKDYAEDFFKLLVNYQDISASEAASRLSLHIRTALKQIIDQEGKPLSDTQIADLLKKRGHSVARRTVAKYRAMEGILPARLRRSNSIQAI